VNGFLDKSRAEFEYEYEYENEDDWGMRRTEESRKRGLHRRTSNAER
jgi:hypothetical protein